MRDTSIEAYEQIKKEGLLSAMRFKIYHMIFKNPNCTASELFSHYDLKTNPSFERFIPIAISKAKYFLTEIPIAVNIELKNAGEINKRISPRNKDMNLVKDFMKELEQFIGDN